jgi:hypothetical protein
LGLKECQVEEECRNGVFGMTSVWLYQICYLTSYRDGKSLTCIKDHLLMYFLLFRPEISENKADRRWPVFQAASQ